MVCVRVRQFPDQVKGRPVIMRSNLRRLAFLCLAVLFVCAVAARESAAQTVARCGEGWLELIDGYPVLHLKGSHYEMGYQQGALLKASIRRNMHNMLVAKADEEVEV